MERQVKKVSVRLEEKNVEIARLTKELVDVREEVDGEVREWREKSKKERREFVDITLALENEVRDLGDKLRFRDR